MQPFALLAASVLPVALCTHSYYGFPDEVNHVKLTSMQSTLQWGRKHEVGNVYMATQFYLTQNAGYFGGQMHDDGKHLILFSIWDHNDTAKNAWWSEKTPWCMRFGGEGEGAHCGLDYTFVEGQNYTFALSFDVAETAANGTGDFWQVTITDDASYKQTLLGLIYLKHIPGVEPSQQMKPGSIAFQEYYTGGSFYHQAGWFGPGFNQDVSLMANDASADCKDGAPSVVTDCVQHGSEGKGPCGKSVYWTEEGAELQNSSCSAHYWPQSENGGLRLQRLREKYASWAPLRTMPTATAPTGVDIRHVPQLSDELRQTYASWATLHTMPTAVAPTGTAEVDEMPAIQI
eukprot:TRINITY_DN37077_c0_g1_i1.p1 TRINITY_DN37077_c0_g1~~TRINITY_DN37077_c0_g1_i1.p1  ORF type:complete len:368 (+),score=66.98 TRINITY_DN37077_c0_g1_i1:71-1105(+)